MEDMERNRVCRILLAGLTVGMLFAGPGRTEAAYVNPYQFPAAVQVADRAEKLRYVAQKTENMFKGTPQAEPVYTVPKGWKEDRTSLKGVRVEKYLPGQKGTDRVLFFLHGGGYIRGLSNSYRDWAIAQSRAIGQGDVYVLDYTVPCHRPGGCVCAGLPDLPGCRIPGGPEGSRGCWRLKADRSIKAPKHVSRNPQAANRRSLLAAGG